ncbi:hypothetical protein [Pontimicrobium aquaticum]|uniref:Co-chaperone DjlA N-terminal domain-containing protein n=1 Tax=Pontimicrobium aquaticum TaxID=2565367 RepID=A0A4U0EV53_9FLAO|nr:hypothetical protein [Pontimicrobium aquaticum]TJY35771.1 hypothetical protein E5167_07825 [Pontimicrobium aquaticum]
MDSNESVVHKFYQNLGKLFYAIASIDGSVRTEELESLKEIVKKEWLLTHLANDDLKLNAQQSIINTFRWLHDDNEYNASECYKSFLIFKNNHETLFTNEVNKLILKTARAIAAAFSKVNKSELMLLAKLDIEFKKTRL